MPIRTCIGCRRKSEPSDFFRVGKGQDGKVGLWNGVGRSVYLCQTQNCIDVALRKTALDRALKTSVSAESKEQLRMELLKKLG